MDHLSTQSSTDAAQANCATKELELTAKGVTVHAMSTTRREGSTTSGGMDQAVITSITDEYFKCVYLVP